MKILHTSDWHLGLIWNSESMIEDQAKFADWFVGLVRQEQVDLVMIAGDLYDRSVPPGPALELADTTFARIIDAGARIVALSGNHDSAERLGFGSRAMAAGGLHIRTERGDLDEIGSPIRFEVDGEAVEIIPVPFLDPGRIVDLRGARRTFDATVRYVVGRRMQEVHDPALTIVMAHAFVVGGTETESERPLVGGLAHVETSAFGGAGYVALGHLHRPQSMADGRIVYSGTPLPYSFSENHQKSVELLVTAKSGLERRTVPVDVGRRAVTIKGTLSAVLKRPKEIGAMLRVVLTDRQIQPGAYEQLVSHFGTVKSMKYAELDAVSSGPTSMARGRSGSIEHRPAEVVTEYVSEVFGEVPASISDAIGAAVGSALVEPR